VVKKSRRRVITLVITLSVFVAALWVLHLFVSDRGRFLRALWDIRRHPEEWIGKGAHVNTMESTGVSSPFIAAEVENAWDKLNEPYGKTGRTYYSDCGDMPTQETIWQLPGYFVRLYATSALELDAAAISVHSGTYEAFRGEELTPAAGADFQYRPIPWKSPRRFLYPDR